MTLRSLRASLQFHSRASQAGTKSILGTLALALGVSMTGASVARTFPERSIVFVNALAPGGSTDIICRGLAGALAPVLGQRVLVENRPGAGGQVGFESVIRAKPDGYTLPFSTNGLAVVHVSNPDFKFDVTRDLAPITLIDERSAVILSSTRKPYKTFAEFIDYGRKNPGAVNYGAAGVSDVLTSAWMHQLAGIKAETVRDQGGSPAVQAAITGEVDYTWNTYGFGKPQVDAGTLRVLAVSGPRRIPAIPGIPSVSEVLPEYSWTTWNALLAPAGTPRDIIAKLNAAVRQVFATPEMRKLAEGQDTFLSPTTPEELGRKIAQMKATWSKVQRDGNIKLGAGRTDRQWVALTERQH